MYYNEIKSRRDYKDEKISSVFCEKIRDKIIESEDEVSPETSQL